MSSRLHEPYLRKWSTNLQVPIISVDYTKAPNEQYPYQLKECYAAYNWVCEHAHELLGTEELKKIIIIGDSAGTKKQVIIMFICLYRWKLVLVTLHETRLRTLSVEKEEYQNTKWNSSNIPKHLKVSCCQSITIFISV